MKHTGNFAMLKGETGYKCEELESLTGYTRQGLDYAFKMMDEGKMPSKKFIVCINEAIVKRIKDEEYEMEQHNYKHTKKIERLKRVQDQIIKFKEATH
jgi:hypothetical protein